jgi:hypothetical protein
VGPSAGPGQRGGPTGGQEHRTRGGGPPGACHRAGACVRGSRLSARALKEREGPRAGTPSWVGVVLVFEWQQDDGRNRPANARTLPPPALRPGSTARQRSSSMAPPAGATTCCSAWALMGACLCGRQCPASWRALSGGEGFPNYGAGGAACMKCLCCLHSHKPRSLLLASCLHVLLPSLKQITVPHRRAPPCCQVRAALPTAWGNSCRPCCIWRGSQWRVCFARRQLPCPCHLRQCRQQRQRPLRRRCCRRPKSRRQRQRWADLGSGRRAKRR